jgi:hypothetical protein
MNKLFISITCAICLSPLMLWVRILFRWDVLATKLCDKVCQWLARGQWFSPVSSTNKTDHLDIAEILLKVALNTIILTPSFIPINHFWVYVRYILKLGYYWKDVMSHKNFIMNALDCICFSLNLLYLPCKWN